MPVKQEDDLKRQLRSTYCEQIIAIRDRKRLVEEKWLNTRRAWMGHAPGHFVPSDSAVGMYSIPTARRVLERTAVRIVKMLTPKVKWHEVMPLSDIPQERLSNIDMFMYYILHKRIKSRANIAQLSRCALLYNMPILKTAVIVENGNVWPHQRVIDPFAFFMFPETATCINSAEIVFEDVLFSYERYKSLVARGMVEPLERTELTKPDWPYHLTERLAYQGITDPTAHVDLEVQRDKISKQLASSTAAFVSLTELWIRRDDVLYQVYIAWNVTPHPRIVGFFKSPYDEPLYRMALHRSLPGETYTNSQAEDILDLDIAQKDLFNMFMDAVAYEQGFIIAGADQAGARKDTWKMKGRAKWEVEGDPREAIQFVQPPTTSTNMLRAYQIAQAHIQSLGGSGSIAEGQPGRNMPRAGNAVGQLIDLASADMEDIANMIEQEILTPSLSDIYKVSASFIPEAQLIRVPGGKAFYGGQQSSLLRKQDILGDYEFEWVGSLQAQDEETNAQRMMIFLNMAPVLNQELAKQGMQLDTTALIQMIWRYSLGQRGLNKVVVPAPPPPLPMEIEQNMQRQQGGTTPAQPGPGPRPPQPAMNGVAR